jgi:hypothetical protein
VQATGTKIWKTDSSLMFQELVLSRRLCRVDIGTGKFTMCMESIRELTEENLTAAGKVMGPTHRGINESISETPLANVSSHRI